MPDLGYYEGTADVYFAQMTNVENAQTPAVYGTPTLLGKSINIKVTPRYAQGQLDASNSRVRNVNRIDGYDVEVGLDQISPANRKDLYNRAVDLSGVHIIAGGRDPKTVALGMKFPKDNGKGEYWWLYKGQFSEEAIDAKTSPAGKIEYRTPVTKGAFDRRINDNHLAAVADEDDSTIPAEVFTGWFTAVYEEDTTP